MLVKEHAWAVKVEPEKKPGAAGLHPAATPAAGVPVLNWTCGTYRGRDSDDGLVAVSSRFQWLLLGPRLSAAFLFPHTHERYPGGTGFCPISLASFNTDHVG
jgi:hypothetical protein